MNKYTFTQEVIIFCTSLLSLTPMIHFGANLIDNFTWIGLIYYIMASIFSFSVLEYLND